MRRLAKFLILSIPVLLLVGGTVSCLGDEEARSTTSVFQVEGMTCSGCELGVEIKVEKLDGVHEAEASYRDRRAVVRYDGEKVTPEAVIEAIEELGYEARLLETRDLS